MAWVGVAEGVKGMGMVEGGVPVDHQPASTAVAKVAVDWVAEAGSVAEAGERGAVEMAMAVSVAVAPAAEGMATVMAVEVGLSARR